MANQLNINRVVQLDETTETILESASGLPEVCDQKIITEASCNKLAFNVMPNLGVEEKLFIKEYRIGKDYIEALFDREYESEMSQSPNHLIFLSVLVHMQKLLYVYMCDYLDLKYDPHDKEVLKVWPTTLDIQMPKLITENTDIVHRMDIKKVRQLKDKVYHVYADTNVNSIIKINGMAMIYVI